MCIYKFFVMIIGCFMVEVVSVNLGHRSEYHLLVTAWGLPVVGLYMSELGHVIVLVGLVSFQWYLGQSHLVVLLGRLGLNCSWITGLEIHRVRFVGIELVVVVVVVVGEPGQCLLGQYNLYYLTSVSYTHLTLRTKRIV